MFECFTTYTTYYSQQNWAVIACTISGAFCDKVLFVFFQSSGSRPWLTDAGKMSESKGAISVDIINSNQSV